MTLTVVSRRMRMLMGTTRATFWQAPMVSGEGGQQIETSCKVWHSIRNVSCMCWSSTSSYQADSDGCSFTDS